MGKYQTGLYILILFNDVGTRLNSSLHESFTAAKINLESYLKEYPKHSGVITRVLYNSAITTPVAWSKD